MEAEEALLKLKGTFPELAEHILQEALLNNDNDYLRASEYLRVRHCKANPSLSTNVLITVSK